MEKPHEKVRRFKLLPGKECRRYIARIYRADIKRDLSQNGSKRILKPLDLISKRTNKMMKNRPVTTYEPPIIELAIFAILSSMIIFYWIMV